MRLKQSHNEPKFEASDELVLTLNRLKTESNELIRSSFELRSQSESVIELCHNLVNSARQKSTP